MAFSQRPAMFVLSARQTGCDPPLQNSSDGNATTSMEFPLLVIGHSMPPRLFELHAAPDVRVKPVPRIDRDHRMHNETAVSRSVSV